MKRRSRARLLLIALAALAAALTHAGARAQTARQQASAEPSSTNSSTPGQPLAARKIDEFGNLGGCDHSARLDNFAIELQNAPGSVGHIIAYGVDGESSGTVGFRLRLQKDYLVNARGIDEDRIVTVRGGPYRERDEAYSELWVVPPGAEAPKPVSYKNDAATFKGKFAEYKSWDGETLDGDPGTGPPVGNTTLAGFAEVLRLQPNTVAYLVTYNGKEAAPGAWRRVGERDAKSLLAGHGIEERRVNILFGGYKKETTVCLWVLPKDAPPPVKAGRKERRPEKAVRVGEFADYVLKYEEIERDAFRGFAEVLKADEHLNVCVVVRPSLPSEQTFNPDFPRDPDEPTDIDLVALAEKWKARLSKEYGIDPHRVTLMVVQSKDDFRAGLIETWVLPAGAPLPDPSAEEALGGGEEGSEQEEGNH